MEALWDHRPRKLLAGSLWDSRDFYLLSFPERKEQALCRPWGPWRGGLCPHHGDGRQTSGPGCICLDPTWPPDNCSLLPQTCLSVTFWPSLLLNLPTGAVTAHFAYPPSPTPPHQCGDVGCYKEGCWAAGPPYVSCSSPLPPGTEAGWEGAAAGLHPVVRTGPEHWAAAPLRDEPSPPTSPGYSPQGPGANSVPQLWVSWSSSSAWAFIARQALGSGWCSLGTAQSR